MTNYTKTTNFATKDSLPSGNANKIVKGTEIDTEFNNIATAVATKADTAGPTFTGTVTIPTADINGGAIDGTTIGAASASSIIGTTIVANTSINIAGDGATVTGIKDEDDMSSNSATKLATQQSIKAYVDSQVTAQDLDVTDGSSSIDIDLDSESLGILGGTGIDSTASGTGVTLAIDSTVATLTGSQTLTNKTLTAPTLTGTAVVASLDISGDVDVDGTLETDALSINSTTVTSTAAELNILDGVTATASELNILDGVTSTTAELNILDGVTSTAAELNILDGKAFLDEDDMSSNSATGIASQQSIKAYVDAQITAEDLDFQADSGGALSIDLDSETLTFTGGTGIDTSGSGNAVTFAIDSTVATLTGTQTLTNKTLTSPDINTPDIDGGTIDNTVIGGSTAAAGSFTTVTTTNAADFGVVLGTGTAGDGLLKIGHFSNGTFIGTYNDDGGAADSIRFGTHSGDTRLTVNSTGIDVTGSVSADGLDLGTTTDAATVSTTASDYQLQLGAAQSTTGDIGRNISFGISGVTTAAINSIDGGSSNAQTLAFFTGNASALTKRLSIDSIGDISFFDTSGNAAVFFDASAAALGIGTSSPTERIHIHRTSGTGAYIRIQDASGGNYIGTDGGVLQFLDGSGLEKMRISGGKLGIGDTNPAAPLSVSYTSNFANPLVETNAGVNIEGSSSVRILMGTNPNSPYEAYIQASNNGSAFPLLLNPSGGNVGIGTSSPGELLSVKGSGNTAVSINTGNNSGDNSQVKFGDSADDDVGQINYDHGTNAMQFRTNGGSNALVIDSSGSVAVGHTSSGGAKFAISNSGNATIQFFPEISTDTNLTQHYDLTAAAYMTSDNRAAAHLFKIGTSEKLRIRSDGNVGIGSTGMPSFSGTAQLSIGPMAHLMAETTSGTSRSLHISQNAHLDADGSWETMETDEATNYYQNDGTHGFRVASSTSAGTDITWTTALLINNSGIVSIGSASHNDDCLYTTRGNNGKLIRMFHGSTEAGALSTKSTGNQIALGSPNSGGGIVIGSNATLPANASGDGSNNSQDLGSSSYRWATIFAQNALNTSDEKLKQDIEELSEAERRVAIACKGLVRKYKFKDDVVSKGADAKIRIGIIAQQLVAAFEAEGLDAHDYGLISLEDDTEQTETGMEKTGTQTYNVNYFDLLAFIISAI